VISLIVGLGNIGDKYSGTRHNLGFDVLNIISSKLKIKQSAGNGEFFYAKKAFRGELKHFIWPTTLMNNSGFAVRQTADLYQIPVNEILVVCDDFNLPLGKIRIRQGGSEGGHNGLASIIYHLETDHFPRLRMGIGPIPENIDPADFVLGKFPENETEIVKKMLGKSAEAVLYSLSNRLQEAMSKYNNCNPAPEEA